MKWPFYSQYKEVLVLECPVCFNKVNFYGTHIDDKFIWNCSYCNNDNLHLDYLKPQQSLIIDFYQLHFN